MLAVGRGQGSTAGGHVDRAPCDSQQVIPLEESARDSHMAHMVKREEDSHCRLLYGGGRS